MGNEFELRVFEIKSGSVIGTAPVKKQTAKLDLIPSNSKTSQIDKVVLLNRGSKDVNKANYRDTLVARAFCTAIFDQKVEFQLWEDDAPGGGHNAAINKNNRHTRTYRAKVNEKGTWNVVITEHYAGSKCTHIEKTPIRNNCRRGKIDVYDHNKKLIFTISDCLLEGIAGEDRMITDADAPYGTYQISSSPFIMGSSSGKKGTSYGP